MIVSVALQTSATNSADSNVQPPVNTENRLRHLVAGEKGVTPVEGRPQRLLPLR